MRLPSKTTTALLLAAFATVLAIACGQQVGRVVPTTVMSDDLQELNVPDEDGAVVKARIFINVSLDEELDVKPEVDQTIESQKELTRIPISVTLSPSAAVTLDTTGWLNPPAANSTLDFGSLKIAALFDNHLRVCGVKGNEWCTSAVIRAYTYGVAGEGLWNTDDAYGIPFVGGLPGSTGSVLGLGPANATILQRVPIGATQRVLRHTDFPEPPVFDFESDFTNAGAGSYSTTLVIEYVLMK